MNKQDNKTGVFEDVKYKHGLSENQTIDTSNHPTFSSYYEEQSEKPQAIKRFGQLKDVLSSFYRLHCNPQNANKIKVLDIGCGAGTQSILWAQAGYTVYGIDVSERLINVARERMAKAGVAVEFQVATAANMPFQTEQMDICLIPEVLEHIADWRVTLEECSRVLKPRGMLYLSTSNALCPLQNEFDLPLYSWYPGFLKRICEQKALTTHRQWVNYATYPAVNWFTPPSLSRELSKLGFKCYDQFDIMDLSKKPAWVAWIVRNLIHRLSFFRYLAYFLTVATVLVGIKEKE